MAGPRPSGRSGFRRRLPPPEALLRDARRRRLLACLAQADVEHGAEQVNLLAATACGDLVSGGCLRHEHCGLQIDLINLVKCLFRDVKQRLLALNTNAIHKNINGAIVFYDEIDKRIWRGRWVLYSRGLYPCQVLAHRITCTECA